MYLKKNILFPSLPLVKMQLLAEFVAALLRPGDVITLSGDLGSGKTTFARSLIKHLSLTEVDVTSPTFLLMQAYDIILRGNHPEKLWHLDLYRLKNSEEVHELGLEEIWPHVTLIEWPEIIDTYIPKTRLDIAFDFGSNQDSRTLILHGDDYWQGKLREFKI